MATTKITITLQEELVAYIRLRKAKTGATISGYIAHLIQEDAKIITALPEHVDMVRKKGKRIWPRAKAGKDPVILASGKQAAIAAASHTEGAELWANIAKWTQVIADAKLNYLWLVLPDSVSNADVMAYDVLRAGGAIPQLRVVRLRDWKKFTPAQTKAWLT